MNIPDYTLLQSCGKGAYGQVWLAQTQMNKLVALKYVANSQAGDREFEGLINYSKLPESPHLIRILHLGKLEDGFFYTMELADGLYRQSCYVPETLAERLRRTKHLPVTEVMELASAMLKALHLLHDAGLVHRDVKPENILYVNGVPKLSDMGLVRSSEETVTIGGTLGFIPPERLKPGNCTAYSASDDLYALGKVLYCALTGNAVERFPSFPAEMINNTLCCHLNQIMLKACGDEKERFQSADEFLETLQGGVIQRVRKTFPIGKKLLFVLFAVAISLAVITTAIVTAYVIIRERPSDTAELPAAAPTAVPAAAPDPQPQKKPARPMKDELLEHSETHAVQLKNSYGKSALLYHVPTLEQALEPPRLGSIPRRAEIIFPMTQEKNGSGTEQYSTADPFLPAIVDSKDDPLFSHPLPPEFVLQAKLSPGYDAFWHYSFRFEKTGDAAAPGFYTLDLAFRKTARAGSVILAKCCDEKGNLMDPQMFLYNYFPNQTEKDIMRLRIRLYDYRKKYSDVTDTGISPEQIELFKTLINRTHFDLEIVKTKSSCSFYVGDILLGTYHLENVDFKNIRISLDLNKTNVMTDLKLFKILPDPDCPPALQYKTPDQREQWDSNAAPALQ